MGIKEFLFNNDYSFLLQIAIILLSTKLLGLLTKRISLPQVVGALAAGIILGPMLLDVVERNDLIVNLAELGVIVLMFSAGLETDIQELKKAGLASFVIALLGVIVPLVGGFFLADFYNTDQNPEMASLFWQNIFIGVVLTATSVSITVETLKELGALNSRAGNAILGAAVIDDILGIIALTVVISLGGKKSGDGEAEKNFGSLLVGDGVFSVVINILAFFIVAIGAAVLYHYFFKKWRESSNENLRRHNIVTFVFCLLLSFVAEICFGVADITGAFVAGLAVSGLKKNEYVVNRFNTLSYMLLSPIFFANIGLAMTLDGLTGKLIVFMLLLMLLAVVTKVIGCGLGAKIMRYTNKESLQIGIGMISRGELARRIGEEVPLLFQPGAKWAYGASADVLGAVLEKAADMPLDELYRENIFKPLGMTDTDFYVPEEKRGRLAQLYNYCWENGKGELVIEPDPHLGMTDYRKKPAFFSGGAGLVSTVRDYMQFANMLAGKGFHRESGMRLIGENTWRYLTTPQLNAAQKEGIDWPQLKGYTYGNLLRVLEEPQACMTNVPAGEFGWDGWTGPYFCVSPQDGTVLLYLVQTCGGSTSDIVRKLRTATFGC